MSTPTQFRHYLISQDAAGANIELIRSGEQVCVLAFDARRLCFVQCHVLLEPLGRNRVAFEERGRALADAGHPLAARVLEFGEDDGSPFYITENVDGETLRAMIARHESMPVWLAQRLTVLALAAQRAVVDKGDFVPVQPLDALRVLQIGVRELRVCAADYRMVEPVGAKTARGKLAKSTFDKQAQFIATYFAEQADTRKGVPAEGAMVGTPDFLELLHNLLLACGPELGDAIEKLRLKLEKSAPKAPEADLAAPYKPRALLAPLLASYQEVARCVVQTVRVQSQKLDPAQPYALRGTLMKTGQNVFVEQVAPLLLAGVTPGEVLRQARSQPKGGKFPNLVPVIFVEESDGVECVAETAVDGITLAEVLATRGMLDAQETYLVLAGVDAALAQLEKAGRIVRRLRLEDVFLFTGFGQGRSQDANLLKTKLNEWPGFSIVLRAHPCMHSMSGRGTDPAMLLPVEPQAKSGVEPFWNGGWMAALSTFLLGADLKSGSAKQGSGEDAVMRMLGDELANARQNSPSPRSNFLARFARVLREHDLAQLKGGGFWQEVSGSSSAQGRAAEVARAATSPAQPAALPASRSRPFGASAVPAPEMEDSTIGFAEALIRGTTSHESRDGLAMSMPAQRGEEDVESSWSGYHQKWPIWMRLALWSLVAITLGAVLAHLQGRALWQRGPANKLPMAVTPQNPNALPNPPPAATPTTPLLPPPTPATPIFPAKPPVPKSTAPDPLTVRLKQLRLAGKKVPGELKPSVDKAAQAGNTEAMLALGNAILSGEPGPSEERTAFGWFKKALDGGNGDARLPLAQCYLEGWGTQADLPRAVGLLVTASKAGEAAAKDLLGVCYARGLGVPRDDNRAFQLCSDAYSAGVPSACGNLGAMYLRGQGTTADPVRAVKLFAEGSKKGDPESMLQYARCLESGTGVALDATQASSWYQKAAKTGNAEAVAWCQQHRILY